LFLKNLAAVAKRRWVLVLIGLVASIGMAFGGWSLAKPTYEVTAAVLLLPPSSTVPEEGNALLQLGGLDLTVDLLGKSLSDQAVTKELEALSPTAVFEVGPDPSSSGPILMIRVRDKSPSMTIRIRDMLVGMAPTRLLALQNAVGVPTRNRVTTSLLVSDAFAEPVGRDKLQGAVLGGAIGLVLFAMVIVLVDSALLRRTARRALRPPRTQDDEDEPDTASGDTSASRPVDLVDPESERAQPDAQSSGQGRRRRRRSVREQETVPEAIGDGSPWVVEDPRQEAARVEAEI